MTELSYFSVRHFAFFLYNELAKYPPFLTLHLTFVSLRENKEDKAYRECAEDFPGYCVVFFLYFSFFFFCSINIRLSTRKYNVESRFCFSHALYLNKLIKALYRNLLSWIKLRTGTDICKLDLLLQLKRLKDFFVVMLVNHRDKNHRSKLLYCSLSLLPLFHFFFFSFKS